MDKELDISIIKDLLNRCRWRWAKSYKSVPHEYIVREKCGLSDSEFLAIVDAQRNFGIYQRWGKYNFPYLYADGYKYWTMGDTYENTIIINRQKIFSEFDDLDNPNTTYYDEEDLSYIVNEIKKYSMDIFEMGCGDGKLAKKLNVSPSSYYAVEPSKKLVSMFRENLSGFSRRISTMSFEESYEKWYDKKMLVVGAFGSASYVMRPYLEILNDSDNDFYVMFYKENYCPEQFKMMHSYNYSLDDLLCMFKGKFIKEYGGYYIVTSKNL